MFKKLLLILGLFAVSPAAAQQITCATRPAGDSSNACASTAFVNQYAPLPLSVPNGGTGQTSFVIGFPVIGGGGGNPLSQGTLTGNTTLFVTSSGSRTSGHCPVWDGSGNLVDSGRPCTGQTYSTKTTAYTVVPGDIGTTILLSGSAFYTVTFPTPSGFLSGPYTIQNIDSRAKKIVLTGGITYTLWPGQSDVISYTGTAWVPQLGPHRYVGGATCYVDNVSGTTAGNTDGLVTGAGAFTTFQGCYQNALANFDTNGALFVVNLGTSQTYTVPHDFTFNGIVTGSAGMVIYGNGSAIAVTTGTTQAAIDYIGPSGQVSIGNMAGVGCTNTGCADVSISYPGELNIYSPFTFFGSTGPHLQSSGAGSVLYVTGTDFTNTPAANTISGSAPQHLQATQNGFLIDYSTSNVLSTNVTITQFAYATIGGLLQGPGGSAYPLTLGGHTITAQQYYAATGGNIANTGGCPPGYWPGATAGSSTGGYCN